jgi:hypothetical protein
VPDARSVADDGTTPYPHPIGASVARRNAGNLDDGLVTDRQQRRLCRSKPPRLRARRLAEHAGEDCAPTDPLAARSLITTAAVRTAVREATLVAFALVAYLGVRLLMRGEGPHALANSAAVLGFESAHGLAGNHYIVDGIVGGALALLGLGLRVLYERFREYHAHRVRAFRSARL